LERVKRVEEEAQVANYSLEEKHMDVVLRAAEEVGYYTDIIGQFRTLLYNTPKTDLLKILIQRCVEIGDQARAIRVTIRMKDMIFEGRSDMFVLRNFGQLKSAEEWAGEKFLTLSREKLVESQLLWTKDKIHTPLTSSVPKDRVKDALTLFACIQSFMGDEKKEDADGDGERIVKGGFNIPEIRDEVYTQIAKQLTSNPAQESLNRGWSLMGACIATFPPTDAMQNFLEVFLKTRAPSKNYVGALHNICYNGPRSTFINRSQFPYIAQILQERTDEYAEKLPEGLPRYADLETPYEPYVDEADFQRVAPNPVKQTAKGKGAPKENLNNTQKMQAFIKNNPWKEYLDDGTGLPYYYNETSGESTWEMPAELKYALTTAPGVRV